MDREASWQVVAGQRRQVARLLGGLPEAAWETPSLCSRWRVRDVAAHLVLAPQPPGPATMAAAAIRAGGRFHRLNHDLTVRHARRPVTVLTAELQRYADSRRLPVVTNYRNILLDTLVHAQDIALPLGHDLPMPPEAATAAATRAWEMGWPFHARRRLRGVRLAAVDAPWSAGAGPEISGPIRFLLLLLTGRDAALPHLSGPGLTRLTRTPR